MIGTESAFADGKNGNGFAFLGKAPVGLAKNFYYQMLQTPGLQSCFQFARQRSATVFMLHRFLDEGTGQHGLDPKELRKGLSFLRKNKYPIISLSDLYHRLTHNVEPLKGSVVFTLDDGYRDQADVAGPIFADFDCPSTTFLTTGFLDGKLWMWWDKIEYIFSNTQRKSLEVPLGQEIILLAWDSDTERNRVQQAFIERCKIVDDDEKVHALVVLSKNAEVELPRFPPRRYSPMSWDDARSWEKKGMTFGPHTVTHPILSCSSSDQAQWEISESWRNLSMQVKKALPVFCYPNGQATDFGSREKSWLRQNGFTGAVTGVAGFADQETYHKDADEPYQLRRMGFPDANTIPNVIQAVSGVERCKQIIRSKI